MKLRSVVLFALFFLMARTASAQCPADAKAVEDSHPSGSRRLLVCSINGKEVSVRLWFANGQLQAETLSAPSAPGTAIASKEWNLEGRLLKETRLGTGGALIETEYDSSTGRRTFEGPIRRLTFFGDRTERHGKWTSFDGDGRRKGEFFYREKKDEAEEVACNGPILDRAIEYGPDDVVTSTTTFDHCAPHGKAVRLHPNGQPAEEITYNRGRSLGPPMRWRPDGTSLVTLNADGQRTRVTIRGFDGSVEIWATYRGADRDGSWTDFYPSGLRKAEGAFRNDQKDGRWLHWYADGTPQLEEIYAAGQLHGLRRRWHADGALAEEEPIANGLSNGLTRRWSSLGILLSATCIQDGLSRWQTTDEAEAKRRACP